jgi:S-adenosylmethionine/arginine decarboxylase-like enzyme
MAKYKSVTIKNKEDFEDTYYYKKEKIKTIDYPVKYPCILTLNHIDAGLMGGYVEHNITYPVIENQKYDYKGYHATADIILKSYPDNLLELVKNSIKHSNLNIVKDSVHDFGGAVTALFTLSESHFSLHEYPEHNYITVDCYTCGEEGDPLAAINNLIDQLESLVGIQDTIVKFFSRGEFDTKTIPMFEKAFGHTNKNEIVEIQRKMDLIAMSLSSDQLNMLNEVIEWCGIEKNKNSEYPC